MSIGAVVGIEFLTHSDALAGTSSMNDFLYTWACRPIQDSGQNMAEDWGAGRQLCRRG